MQNSFANALESNAERYDVELSADAIACLCEYFALIQKWNGRLHLVAPCTAEEFATRHVLESLTALRFLKENSNVVDIGSGGGLPVIPCLLVRQSLNVTLIESSQKKTVFLREALRLSGNKNAKVLAQRFEETENTDADFVTCRAIENFRKLFNTIVDWSPKNAVLLFFGGNDLRAQIEKANLNFEAVQMPDSEKRFLFAIRKS